MNAHEARIILQEKIKLFDNSEMGKTKAEWEAKIGWAIPVLDAIYAALNERKNYCFIDTLTDSQKKYMRDILHFNIMWDSDRCSFHWRISW